MKASCLLATLMLFGVLSTYSQQLPKARIVDQFANPDCEVLWARLDYFLVELSKNPDAFATIAVSGKMGELRDDLLIEDMIRGYFLRMKGLPNRWKIVRMPRMAERRIDLWITPAGGELPKIEATEWSLVYPRDTKPFMFVYDPNHMEDVSVCLPSNRLRLLAQVLEANPSARTNVVLVVRSRKEFARRMRQTIAELVNDYGVSRKQIRMFKKVTRTKAPYNIEPDVEYWLVP